MYPPFSSQFSGETDSLNEMVFYTEDRVMERPRPEKRNTSPLTSTVIVIIFSGKRENDLAC